MQKPEQEKSENLEKNPTLTKKKEGLFKPIKIFDGKCDHYYEDVELDPEGNMFARCRKCPMGRLYQQSAYIIVKGRLNER